MRHPLLALAATALLAGCSHAAPTTITPASATAVSAAARPDPTALTLLDAKQTHSYQHLQVHDVYTIVAKPASGEPLTLVAAYTYRPWMGNGFNTAAVDGAALDQPAAATYVAALQAAGHPTGLDASAIDGALEILHQIVQPGAARK